MIKNSQQIAVTSLLLIAISGCSESSSQVATPTPAVVNVKDTPGLHMAQKFDITDPDASLDMDQKPAIAAMTQEQRRYTLELIAATRRVIEGASTLEAEEKNVFGQGEFFWPKDPGKPVMRTKFFMRENFRMHGISLSFVRPAEGAPWKGARLGIHPINFPQGVYEMSLPPDTFVDYRLERAELSEHPDQSLKRANVFTYVKKGDSKLEMTIEAREDVSSLHDVYPSSFHSLVLRRLD